MVKENSLELKECMIFLYLFKECGLHGIRQHLFSHPQMPLRRWWQVAFWTAWGPTMVEEGPGKQQRFSNWRAHFSTMIQQALRNITEIEGGKEQVSQGENNWTYSALWMGSTYCASVKTSVKILLSRYLETSLSTDLWDKLMLVVIEICGIMWKGL